MKRIFVVLSLAISFSFSVESQVLEKSFEPISLQYMNSVNQKGSFDWQLAGLAPHATLVGIGSPGDKDKKTGDRILVLLSLVESLHNAVIMYDKFIHGMPDAAENLTEAKGILRNAAFKYSRAKAKSREAVGEEWRNADPKLQAIYTNLLAIDLDEKVLAYYEKYLKNAKDIAVK